jgi:hypothetical protein
MPLKQTRDPATPGRTMRIALWAAFLAVHAGLTWIGVVYIPGRAFYDVDLYRWWMDLGLHHGHWPVLDSTWVYPAGAIAPMLLPALGTATSTPGYALGWCLLVTALDACAVAALLARTGRAIGAWWWVAYLALLGPVGVGRLDAIIVPLMVIGLVAAAGSSPAHRAASVWFAIGAWVKVVPGALLLPLAAAARRPWRDVVMPAALVTALVVGAVAAGGGAGRALGFAVDQGRRGLQIEAVGATPWMTAWPSNHGIRVFLNTDINTFEVTGPGTSAMGHVLDALLVASVAAVGWALWVARRRGVAVAAMLPAATTLLVALMVTDKVGSPQYIAWFAAPIAVALSLSASPRPRWLTTTAALGLVIAALTQMIFPWIYDWILTGHGPAIAVLAVRNLLLLGLLGAGVSGLVTTIRPRA